LERLLRLRAAGKSKGDQRVKRRGAGDYGGKKKPKHIFRNKLKKQTENNQQEGREKGDQGEGTRGGSRRTGHLLESHDK